MRFALLAGDHATDFVVIGGLNPDFLAPRAPVPHLGTTDVDLLFELGFVYDRDELDFGWLDRALHRGGFAEVQSEAGWQWIGVLGDARIRLDLLCDVPDNPGLAIHLPGATEAAAQNLSGPAAALLAPIERELDVPESVRREIASAPRRISLRFASLGGYVAAKSAAFIAREQEKDAYDLAFVLMYAPGGPRAVADAVAALTSPTHLPSIVPTMTVVGTRLIDRSSPWIDRIVRQLQLAGDESEAEQLAADVRVAVTQFSRRYADLTGR